MKRKRKCGRVLALFLGLLMLIPTVSGCAGKKPPEVRIFSEYKVYQKGYLDEMEASCIHDDGEYKLKLSPYTEEYEGIRDRKLRVNGGTYTVSYDWTRRYEGENYEVDFFSFIGEPNTFMYLPTYKHGTDEIVEIAIIGDAPSLVEMKRPMETEEDFQAAAREIAGEYIDVEDYEPTVERKNKNDGSYYYGDEYIFTRMLAGIPTNDRLIISITPEGNVTHIERRGIDMFQDFEGITFDKEKFQTALEDAESRVADSNNLFKKKSSSYSYYLINDGGTLCACVRVECEGWPFDQEEASITSLPAYDYDKVWSWTFDLIIPLAEVVK